MCVLVAEWWRCSGEGELRELLNEWDPIGVFDMDLDRPPDDEYDPYLSPVFTALREGGAVAEVRRALESALGRMGLGPAGEREDLFAERIARWWRESSPKQG
jgi:hypothetical protein